MYVDFKPTNMEHMHKCATCGEEFDKRSIKDVIKHAHIDGVGADDFELDDVKEGQEVVTHTTPLDRYGKCPNCQAEWDGGDILNNLRRLQVLSEKTEEELVNIAFQGFGYQKSNPKNFSRVIAISVVPVEPNGINPHTTPNLYMCPECRQVWDALTGKHYGSLFMAKNKDKYELNSTKSSDEDEEQAAF